MPHIVLSNGPSLTAHETSRRRLKQIDEKSSAGRKNINSCTFVLFVGVHPSREVGLVIYNANSDLGLDVQFMNWTTNVDHFLGTLSGLAFNGDNLNNHTMVEGLAEALVMFPRPPNGMTLQEYYKSERHCILVATGEPVARRMLVSVPMVEGGNFVGTQVKPLNANFLEVARMFGPLAVTLSIITPKQHPMFAEIFKVGNPNNDSLMVNTPITDHGPFTVLLSRKFKESHRVLYKKETADSASKGSVEPMRTTIDDTFFLNFINNHEEDLFLVDSPIMGEQTIEGVQNVIPEHILVEEPVIPRIAADENMGMTVPPAIQHAAADENIPVNMPLIMPPSAEDENLPMNVFDDIMAELCNEGDIFPPRKKAKITFAPILEEDSLRDHSQPDPPIPILTLGNRSNSGLSLPQNNPNIWHQPSGGNSTVVRLGTGNSMFPNQLQSGSSPSFPMLPPRGGSCSHNPLQRHRPYEMNGLTPLGIPLGTNYMNMMHQYNQSQFWPRPPPLNDIHNYVHAWEGCLVGKIHLNRSSLNQAKALRIPTSPATLTVQWSSRLEIALFLPKRAVNHTMKICGGPIHFMFFHLTQFNNLDLYDHLMNKSLVSPITIYCVKFSHKKILSVCYWCAKIELPSQALILSTTESKHHYLGMVFPG
ncbi:Mediator of RNA polymerase II transcription subunit 25, partial [Mucuna pruriens]